MSVFSIAGSLLGGILGRNSERKAIDRMNAYNDPAAIRARYEAAGFNPLLGIGPGVDLQTTPGGSNFMGEALAGVSLQLGEMASRPKAVMSIGKMNNIAAQNARLAEENRTLRLQPSAPSVYQRGGPSVRAGAATGGASGTSGQSALQAAGGFLVDGFGVRLSFGTGGHSGGGSAPAPIHLSPNPTETPAASDDKGLPGKNPIRFLGMNIFPSGWFSDAETAEARYSEAGGFIQGAASAIVDPFWNLGRIVKNWSFDPKYRRVTSGGVDLGGRQARRDRAGLKLDRDISLHLGLRNFDAYGPGFGRR